MTELLITNDSNMYAPIVQEGVEWQTERVGTPGKLTFKVLKDDKLDITEGNNVIFKDGNDNIFNGFIFTKKRDKDGIITITAYDQLRYFKNKDTYVYENKTASQVIEMIAKDFRLQTGGITDTKYKIASRVEDDQTLFDIAQNALDVTLTNTNTMYVLFDDYGKLTLKALADMNVDLIIDETSGENYDYTSTIDEQTYNQIKLYRDNEDTGKRDVWIAKHSENINKWGVLQLSESIEAGENGKAKADALLKLYNAKTRKLSLSNIKGDNRVRAGSMVVVMLDLGDVKVQSYMLVESCKHTYKHDEHMMNLTVRGGEFV